MIFFKINHSYKMTIWAHFLEIQICFTKYACIDKPTKLNIEKASNVQYVADLAVDDYWHINIIQES